MSIIRKVLCIMGAFLDGLKDDIATIHNEHEIEQEVTDKVTAAVTASVSAKIDVLTASVTETQEALTEVVAHLKNGDTSAALTAAQAAVEANTAGEAANTPVDPQPDSSAA